MKKIISAIGVWTLGVPIAHAQGFGLGKAAANTGIVTSLTVTGLISRILTLALGFVGTLFLLLMLYAGFLWMTARGDEKKVTSAKQMIVGAVIGLIIIASSYAVTSLVLKVASSNTAPASSPSGSGGTTGGAECKQDSDCPKDKPSCNEGSCVTEVLICTQDSDCNTGQTCQDKDANGEGTCK